MAEPKTRKTEASVSKFIEDLDHEQKRDDCFEIIKMMKKAADAEPKMWGASIVGFGSQLQRYASGKSLDWPVVAFSPRKQNITLYLSPDVIKNSEHLKKLGKYKASKGCLYIKSLNEIDRAALVKIINSSVKSVAK